MTPIRGFLMVGRRSKLREIIIQTYAIILPIILSYIVWLLKKQKKDRIANTIGTMLLLRVQMIDYHDKWTQRGYTTKHGLENFIEMHEAYHTLGGNGMIAELLNEIKELPIK